jgi:hypothetical protein
LEINSISMPVFAGSEALAMSSDRVLRSATRAAAEKAKVEVEAKTAQQNQPMLTDFHKRQFP